MLPLYQYLCTGYLPENLFFPEDQVNQGDREDPKSKRQGEKEEMDKEREWGKK